MKARFSAAMCGKKFISAETRLEIGQKLRGQKKPNSGKKGNYIAISPSGNIIAIIGLRQFCKENLLPYIRMNLLLNGKNNSNGHPIQTVLGWKRCNITEKNTQSKI